MSLVTLAPANLFSTQQTLWSLSNISQITTSLYSKPFSRSFFSQKEKAKSSQWPTRPYMIWCSLLLYRNPNPSIMLLRGGVFGRWLGPECPAPWLESGLYHKRGSFCPVRTWEKAPHLTMRAPDLGLPASRTTGDKLLLFVSLPAYGTLL